EAVAASVRVLEQMIREEPWGWHPWQRLRVDVSPDGTRRYSLKQYGFEEGKRLNGKAAPPTQSATNASARVTASQLVPPRPRVAIVANSSPPYRVHLHERIVREVPDVELWSLSTHGNSYARWHTLRPPASIRPIEFGRGEPSNEQPDVLHSW